MIDQNDSPCPENTGSMPEIFQLIDDLEKRFILFQAATLKESRLTLPQYYILSLLAEKDGRPFKELAEALACTRATVTGIVDTLEKKALVTRQPHPDDRRSMLVNLTDEGKALLQSTPGLEATYGCCCDVLPPDESRELSRLLKKLSDILPF
jgi:MarR family transcriptional regulator, organic hydroperoxide resistance regulator